MALQTTWFGLWGLLWAIYFMLDGFDLGAGILHPFLGKSEADKRVIVNTLGPVWDGNEVWLVTAGGATFAAFPTTYAFMFSWLYTPLLLILFALIFRGVAFEFRGKGDSDTWRKWWDIAIFLGSLIPALLFGVAFGNIFRGLAIEDGFNYVGNFWMLLNPYALLTGVFFVLLFITHAALWLSIKTDSDLSARSRALAKKLWIPLLVVAVAFLVFSLPATRLFDNYIANPLWFVVPLIAVAALVTSRLFMGMDGYVKAFFASCVTIVMVTFTGIIGLFPNLIPSNIDPAYGLTAFNSSSSQYTLTIMTVVVAIFVPIVLAYQIWSYKIFSAPVTEDDLSRPNSY